MVCFDVACLRAVEGPKVLISGSIVGMWRIRGVGKNFVSISASFLFTNEKNLELGRWNTAIREHARSRGTRARITNCECDWRNLRASCSRGAASPKTSAITCTRGARPRPAGARAAAGTRPVAAASGRREPRPWCARLPPLWRPVAQGPRSA